MVRRMVISLSRHNSAFGRRAHHAGVTSLAARGETPAAFDGRCIPAGRVAPRSNTPGIATPPCKARTVGAPPAVVAPQAGSPARHPRWGAPAGRLARLGATPAFHHGLLVESLSVYQALSDGDQHELGGLVDAECGHQVGAMHGDGVGADAEQLAD